MKYCQECGKPVGENAKYCPSCGTLLDSVEIERTPKDITEQLDGTKKLHCPKCRSRNIVPTIEKQTTQGTALFGKSVMGLGLATMSAETATEYDWLCKDCGIRFPNIASYDKKIVSYGAAQMLSKWVGILIGLITIHFAATGIWKMVLIMLGVEAFLVGAFYYARFMRNKLIEERYAYEKACFE